MYLVKNKKSPNYQVVYFINGRRTTVSTNTSDKKKAEAFFGSLKKGTKQLKQRVSLPKYSSISILEFMDEYLDYAAKTKSQNYIRSIKLSFAQLIEYTGNAQLNELDTRTFDKFITSIFARTQKGAHLYYRTLKAAFSKAVTWNYIQENPFKKIKFPRLSNSYPVFISLEEFKIIISKTNEGFLRDLFTTAFYTGMRLGELVNMKWNWIDLKNNVISVKCSGEFFTKNKKERIIPINSTLKAVLLKGQPKIISIDKNEFVFTKTKGVKLNEDYVSKKFKKAVRTCGLNEKIHFHTLRHSFASLLVQKGVSLYVVKELLGHEDLSTTQIYSHLQQQNLRDAVNLI